MPDTILLIEDEAADVERFMRVTKEVGVANPIQVAQDGQEALDYFSGIGRFSNREEFPLPTLVLLDLNLPYRMGMFVLQWLRAQTQFKSTIVIVLTASENPSDISQAYKEGANAYLVKPSNLEGVRHLIRNLKSFWLNTNLQH